MQPKRGRPSEADPHAVARVALRLFERQGFEQVTMEAVAEAAGISRRTLFRLFPAKADLVWDGLREILGAIRAKSAPLADRAPSVRVVFDQIVVPVLRALDDPKAAAVARRRLRIIAAAPALLNHATLAELQAVIAGALAKGAARAKRPPSLVARTLVSVCFGAILWWAEQGEEMTALEATRTAVAALTDAHGPQRP
jgi:AcrR family transcriptional regulator